MNFDAVFHEGNTVTGVILPNHEGHILRAWVNRFASQNAYCSEAEAAAQALLNAEALRLEQVEFEGDSFNVIMALNDVTQAEDWHAIHLILQGRKLLQQHCHWIMKHTLRDCNFSAHHLAQWAKSLPLCGSIDLTTLSPAIWCDRGGTF